MHEKNSTKQVNNCKQSQKYADKIKRQGKIEKIGNNMYSSCDCGSQLPLVLRPVTA